jgi:hypothetical protein
MLLLLFPSIFDAHAAIQFDVFAGFDGIVHVDNWFPVVCEVNNDGPSFQAVFELSPSQFGGNQKRRYAIELPTNTRKRFCIPAFASTRYSTWDARLYDEKGKIRAEILSIRPRVDVNRKIPLLGAMPRSFSGLPVFPEISNPSPESKPAVAHIRPELFPDHPITLEGMDALYLNSEKALDLKTPQIHALTAWVYQGGHLIVSVEQPSDITATPWLADLLPCSFASASSGGLKGDLHAWVKGPDDGTPLERGANFMPQNMRNRPGTLPNINQMSPAMRQRYGIAAGRQQGTVPETKRSNPFASIKTDIAFDSSAMQVFAPEARDGTVEPANGDSPLFYRAQRGRGLVTALTFNPEREPIRSWKNRGWLWARLALVPPELLDVDRVRNNNVYGGMSMDGLVGAIIDSKQVRKLPLGWLIFMLLVYLVVIGPLDQYVLKKLNRQMWTWVTFPSYVVLFSGLIYLIGYKLRSGETEWNEVHLVDIVPRQDHADMRGRTFISVYSPANARFPLSSDLGYATLRGEAQGGGGQDASSAEVSQLAKGFKAEIVVPVWTSQLFVDEWLRTGPPPINATIKPETSPTGAGFTVVVTNQLNRVLTHVRLALGNQMFLLGELPASQSKTFILQKNKAQSIDAFITDSQGNDFTMAVQERRQAFGRDQRERTWDLPASFCAMGFMAPADFSNDPNNSGWAIPSPPKPDSICPRISTGVTPFYLPGMRAMPRTNRSTNSNPNDLPETHCCASGYPRANRLSGNHESIVYERSTTRPSSRRPNRRADPRLRLPDGALWPQPDGQSG